MQNNWYVFLQWGEQIFSLESSGKSVLSIICPHLHTPHASLGEPWLHTVTLTFYKPLCSGQKIFKAAIPDFLPR